MTATSATVHIGFGKTASSSLQTALFRLKPELEKQGYLYDTADLPDKQHSHLAHRLRHGETAAYRHTMQLISDAFARKRSRHLVLSGENFSGLERDAVAALHGDLAAFGAPRAVLYVRNLYRFALSQIAETSKQGRGLAYPHTVLAATRRFSPTRVIGDWEAVFGADNVLVESLDDLSVGANIVDNFLTHIGFAADGPVADIRARRSVDPIASALLTHLAYEFGMSAKDFYAAYFRRMGTRRATPRVETRLVELAKPWVEKVDLSHPKLAKHAQALTSPPSAGPREAADELGKYLADLAGVLLDIAAQKKP